MINRRTFDVVSVGQLFGEEGRIREVGSFLHMGGINLRLKQKCLCEGESGNSGDNAGRSC